jgi:hypothetical protein
MVRRRRRRNYQPADDAEEEFDETFVVRGQETFYINDQEIVVEDAVHAIKDGQEYVIIDDQLYPLDRPGKYIDSEDADDTYDQESEVSDESSPGIGSYAVLLFYFVIGALVVFFAAPVVMGFVSGLSDSGNENVISPGNGQDIPAIEPIRVQSKESETAAKIKEAMDYTDPTTRDFAVSLIPNSHEGKYNIAQICDLWDAVYNKWTYVNDPRGSDYFSPASRTIQLGLKGDCDDFAITVGSVVQSIGGSSRIVTAYNGDVGHAYPEVLICNSKACMENIASYIGKRYNSKNIAYHTTTKNGVTQYWLNLDWQSRYPGGKFFHDADGQISIYYPNGYWYKSG